MLGRPVPWLVGFGGLLIVPVLIWLLQPRSPPLDPQRVVIAPFENRTGDPGLDPIGLMAADWITEGIAHAAGVNVVPTTAALVSARRVQDDLAAGTPVDSIRALAEETGAGVVVSGAYYLARDSLVFHVQITDARQRRLVRALEPTVGERDAPEPAIGALRQRTVAGLAPFLDPRTIERADHYGQPPSYEAHHAFVEGLELQIRGRWRESIAPLERALAVDSAYLAPWWLLLWAHLNTGEHTKADSTHRRLDHTRERLTPLQQTSLDIFLAIRRADRIAIYEAARRAVEVAPQGLTHAQFAAEAVWLNRPREAIRILSEIDPTRGVMRGWPLYWTAATEAHHVLGDHRRELREARRARALFALLQEAIGQGYEYGWEPRHAPCLDPVRNYTPFRELMRSAG